MEILIRSVKNPPQNKKNVLTSLAEFQHLTLSAPPLSKSQLRPWTHTVSWGVGRGVFFTYKSLKHRLLGGGGFGHSLLTFNNYLISQLYIIQNWGGRGSGGVSWWWCGVGGVGEFLLFNPKIIWFSENVTFFRNFEIFPKFVNIFPKKKIGKTFCCKLLPLM